MIGISALCYVIVCICNIIFCYFSKEKQEILEYTGISEGTLTGSFTLHKLSLEEGAEEPVSSKELGSYSLETAGKQVHSRYMHKIS